MGQTESGGDRHFGSRMFLCSVRPHLLHTFPPLERTGIENTPEPSNIRQTYVPEASLGTVSAPSRVLRLLEPAARVGASA